MLILRVCVSNLKKLRIPRKFHFFIFQKWNAKCRFIQCLEIWLRPKRIQPETLHHCIFSVCYKHFMNKLHGISTTTHMTNAKGRYHKNKSTYLLSIFYKGSRSTQLRKTSFSNKWNRKNCISTYIRMKRPTPLTQQFEINYITTSCNYKASRRTLTRKHIVLGRKILIWSQKH